MAGGGVKGGCEIGKTDELGFNAVEDKVHVHDLNATILHLLGFDRHARHEAERGVEVGKGESFLDGVAVALQRPAGHFGKEGLALVVVQGRHHDGGEVLS